MLPFPFESPIIEPDIKLILVQGCQTADEVRIRHALQCLKYQDNLHAVELSH
jgi:hypothetical protein